MSYSCHQLLPLTARSTVPRRQCVTHSHSLLSRTHSTAIASSYPRGGTVGERLGYYGTGLTRKRGARHGNAIYCLMPESTRTAGTERESCTRPSYKTRAPKYALLPYLLKNYSLENMQPAPLPPLNNPTPEQAFLLKNYDENARRADRDPRGIFRTPTDASAPPAAGLVGPLGSSSFSLPTVERALAEMEGASSGATLGGGLRRAGGAPTSPILGGAPSPTQHEVLQNFFKSLLNPKDRAASPGTSAVSPGAAGTAAGKPAATGPRTSSGSAGASGSGESQTDADADTGSGAEDG
jgi:hypothetical protein